jgi:hypothetical protein
MEDVDMDATFDGGKPSEEFEGGEVPESLPVLLKLVAVGQKVDADALKRLVTALRDLDDTVAHQLADRGVRILLYSRARRPSDFAAGTYNVITRSIRLFARDVVQFQDVDLRHLLWHELLGHAVVAMRSRTKWWAWCLKPFNGGSAYGLVKLSNARREGLSWRCCNQ